MAHSAHVWQTSHRSPASSTPSSGPSPAYPMTPLPNDPTNSNSNLQRSNSSNSSRSNASASSSRASQTQVKGGCWTCRLRRKRCDEQREHGSCHTCNRLGINCLGWGAQRPDWMRNKQCVDAYKAEIKAHLTRAGLIRGQPRTAALRLRPVPLDSLPYPIPAVAGPQQPSASDGKQRSNRHSMPVSFTETQSSRRATVPQLNDNPHLYQIPDAAYSEPAFINKFDLDFTPPIHLSPSPATAACLPPSTQDYFPFDYSPYSVSPDAPNTVFDYDFGINPTLSVPEPFHHPPANEQQFSLPIDHTQYYFENVARLCKIFGTTEFNTITYSLVMQDPQGPLASILAAFSCLHQARTQGNQHGFQAAQQYHTDAIQHLSSSRMICSYTESDAFTAIHLVSYSIFSGSQMTWRWPFEYLLEWVSQCGIQNHENPGYALQRMSNATRSIILLTLWIDVVSSPVTQRAPQLMMLCRSLFQNDTSAASCSLYLRDLTGCSVAVLIAIAEVGFLGHWKQVSIDKNLPIDYEDLLRRVQAIGDQYARNKSRLALRTFQPASFSVMQNSTHVEKIFDLVVEISLRVVSDSLRTAETIHLLGTILDLVTSYPTQAPHSVLYAISLAGVAIEPSKRELVRRLILADTSPFGNRKLVLQDLEVLWSRDNAYDSEIKELIRRTFTTNLIL